MNLVWDGGDGRNYLLMAVHGPQRYLETHCERQDDRSALRVSFNSVVVVHLWYRLLQQCCLSTVICFEFGVAESMWGQRRISNRKLSFAYSPPFTFNAFLQYSPCASSCVLLFRSG